MSLSLDKLGRLKVSEAQLQKASIELLRAEGWIVRPAPRDGRKASRGAFSVPAGEPDVVAVKWFQRRWHVLLPEFKSSAGELSQVQQGWHWLHDDWPDRYLIRSVDDVRAILKRMA